MTTNATGSTTCTNCTNKPANASFNDSFSEQTSNSCPWTCFAGFYQTTSAPQGQRACLACVNAPIHAVYSGPGTSMSNCPWQCAAGFLPASTPSVGCVACKAGTYSSASGSIFEVTVQNVVQKLDAKVNLGHKLSMYLHIIVYLCLQYHNLLRARLI